jgi:hypothetical protein
MLLKGKIRKSYMESERNKMIKILFFIIVIFMLTSCSIQKSSEEIHNNDTKKEEKQDITKLAVINKNTEEGFQDLAFTVTNHTIDKEGNIVVAAYGQFESKIVGFNVTFSSNKIQLDSIGEESNEFLKSLSKLYEIEYKNQIMVSQIKFTSIGLSGDSKKYEQEYLKFKCFYDENNEKGLYSEFYINVDIKNDLLEFKEKDSEYRQNIIKALSS